MGVIAVWCCGCWCCCCLGVSCHLLQLCLNLISGLCWTRTSRPLNRATALPRRWVLCCYQRWCSLRGRTTLTSFTPQCRFADSHVKQWQDLSRLCVVLCFCLEGFRPVTWFHKKGGQRLDFPLRLRWSVSLPSAAGFIRNRALDSTPLHLRSAPIHPGKMLNFMHFIIFL